MKLATVRIDGTTAAVSATAPRTTKKRRCLIKEPFGQKGTTYPSVTHHHLRPIPAAEIRRRRRRLAGTGGPPRRPLAATRAALRSISEIPLNSIASPLSRRYPRGFTFYVARPRAPFLGS